MCAIMDIGDDAHEPDYFKIKELGTLTVAEPLILKNVDYNVTFLSNFLF